MKTTYKFLSAIFCTIFLISLNSQAQYEDMFTNVISENTLCLEMKGKIIKKSKNPTNTYTVILIHDNTIVATETVKDNKSFRFNLCADTYYAIKIYKEGYAPKLISVHTTLPEEKYKEKFFRFHFKIELTPEEEFECLNEESKDFPIALVTFNKAKKTFNYNEKYTRNIKNGLYGDITVPKY